MPLKMLNKTFFRNNQIKSNVRASPLHLVRNSDFSEQNLIKILP